VVRKASTSVKSRTDFARLDKMKDEDIDYSDAPAITPEMFTKAIVQRGLKPRTKTQLTLRVDSDVLEWLSNKNQSVVTRLHARTSKIVSKMKFGGIMGLGKRLLPTDRFA